MITVRFEMKQHYSHSTSIVSLVQFLIMPVASRGCWIECLTTWFSVFHTVIYTSYLYGSQLWSV